MAGRYTRDDLNEKQRKFVDLYIECGGDRQMATANYMAIWEQPDKRTASSAVSRLLKNPKIKDVLADECVASFAALAVVATDKLADMLITGMWHGQPVKATDGLKAIKMAMERSIGPVITQTNITVDDKRSAKEIKAEIIQELKSLSDTDKAAMLQALESKGLVIDIEAEEVIDPAAPWGRKKDGRAAKKPGRKNEKRRLPGPDAHNPEARGKLKTLRERIKERKLAAVTKETSDD